MRCDICGDKIEYKQGRWRHIKHNHFGVPQRNKNVIKNPYFITAIVSLITALLYFLKEMI